MKSKPPIKPTGYQKRILRLFCTAFQEATGEPYGISWGWDNRGASAIWERATGAIVGTERLDEPITETEAEEAFKLIERRLKVAVELYRRDRKYNPFPWSLETFAEKMNSYVGIRAGQPATETKYQTAEELLKELES